jgi:hypothetical protein
MVQELFENHIQEHLPKTLSKMQLFLIFIDVQNVVGVVIYQISGSP